MSHYVLTRRDASATAPVTEKETFAKFPYQQPSRVTTGVMPTHADQSTVPPLPPTAKGPATRGARARGR